MGRNAKLKERHKWSDEQPKLDNATRLRGIYFIDPEDKEFKEAIKNARKKIGITDDFHYALQDKKFNEIKSKLGCILEASESTILSMEDFLPNYHEDHIAGKGDKFTAAL